MCFGTLFLVTVVYFYTALISFASGIFIRSFFNISWSIMIWWLLLAFGIALVRRRQREALAAPYLGIVTIILLGIVFGSIRLELSHLLATAPVLLSQVGHVTTLSGIVMREPDLREKSTHLTVRVGQELVLVTADRYSTIQYGDLIYVHGKLALPISFDTDLGRTFNYPGYLRARGISYTMSFASLTLREHGQANLFLQWLYKNKHRFTHVLETQIPEPQVGLSEGLLLGIQQALGPTLNDVFRRTGIIHVVVLSGYNIMIVATFFMYLLAVLLPLRARTVVGIVAIIIFAILVGLSATVMRATIMAALYLIGQVTARRYIVLRGLFFAGVVMLLINPYLLVYDIGFQLSFMATLGLILVSPHLEQFVTRVPTFADARGFLLATLATQVVVLPILLYQMGQFSLVAVIVNVLVLPMVAPAMLCTFLTGIFAILTPPLAIPCAYVAYVILSYILAVATWFAALPFAAVTIPAFPFWLVPLGYGGIAGLVYLLYRRSHAVRSTTLFSDVADWSIMSENKLMEMLASHEQKTIGQELHYNSAATSVASESDVPIFFR